MSTSPPIDSQLVVSLRNSLGAAYTIERELGGGGMSRVFLAEETRLGRRVVVKLLSPELSAGVSAERFEREARAVAALPVLLEYCLPLCRVGGRVVAQKGEGVQEEVEGARNALRLLGNATVDIKPVSLPCLPS